MITKLSHQVCEKFPCGSLGGLRLFVSPTKDVLMCLNVGYTFDKIVEIAFDGIRGRIRMYRFRYNLIILININILKRPFNIS